MTEPIPLDDASRLTAPFRALITAWSLVVVVLSVAGYSYRWNYYYNFGLQSLVFSTPLQSLPMYAIELVRNPAALLRLIVLAVIYLLPFHLIMLSLRTARAASWPGVQRAARYFMRALALDNELVVEGISAVLIVLVAFRAGGDAGLQAYYNNVVEQNSHLPKVTAITRADSADPAAPITCDTRTFKDPPAKTPSFIGEPDAVNSLISGTACSTSAWSWRLLLRDDKFVYLFATVPDQAMRPQTVVLPNNENLILVFR